MWRSELTPGLSRFFAGINPQVRLGGWERLTWGMSVGEVRRNYPQAIESNSGSTLTLESEDPTDRHWTITFSFDSARSLESVTLSFAGSEETADFATISQAITRRLGAPVSSDANTTTWQSDDSQVTLSREPRGGLVLSQSV